VGNVLDNKDIRTVTEGQKVHSAQENQIVIDLRIPCGSLGFGATGNENKLTEPISLCPGMIARRGEEMKETRNHERLCS
jgi:hypothetical protein